MTGYKCVYTVIYTRQKDTGGRKYERKNPRTSRKNEDPNHRG